VGQNISIRELEESASIMRENILKLSNQTMVHIGGDLSMADMLTALYLYKIRKDLNNHRWPERDRFVLSKGHGAGCLYIAMAMAGYGSLEEIFSTYGQLGSRYGMHPCKNQNPGMEVSSGSLGHGTTLCSGMALAAKLRGDRHYVFTMMGDGELDEGSVWEGAMAAANFKLGNLVVLVDRNRFSLNAGTEDEVLGMKLEPLADKWRAFGWKVVEMDGHNMTEIVRTLDSLPDPASDVPTVIIGHTIKGKGVSFLENQASWHHGVLNDEQLEQALGEIRAARKAKGE